MKSDDIISSEWSEMMNDLEVSFKQQGYVRCYTSEEIQKIADLQQSMIEKAFELGREDAMSEIVRCIECRNYKQYINSGEVLGFCRRYIGEMPKPNDYCSWAERREE